MTAASHTRERVRLAAPAIASSRTALWTAFVVVHLWLGYLNFYPYLYGLGDVSGLYRLWAEQALTTNYWVGIDSVSVYPIGALVPILAAAAFGLPAYASTWMLLVAAINAAAFAFLIGKGSSDSAAPRFSARLAWWWLLFLVLLGPIAFSRIDAFTIPFALVGVLLAARRPVVAAVLLAVATWIKVWPAVLLAALVITSRARVRVIIAAAAVSVVILGTALAFGSGANVLSFITQQTGRGLQVEAPVTTFWMWQAFAGVSGVGVYYDTEILTFQVTGAGVDTAAALMTPLLVVVVALVCALGFLAARRGAGTQTLAPLSLALVTALIAFNKVGSPQFFSWLCVPIVLGLALSGMGMGRPFRIPAALVLAIALLTQIIYPMFYNDLLAVNPVLLVVLTVRNIAVFVLLGWAIAALIRLARDIHQPGIAKSDITQPSIHHTIIRE